MLIKEVILENFMSYEYGRVRLKPGLNIVCGPNGAGKSSILLAISIALGQAYTERGRRLSDLIRRGKDTARVTVVLDNSPKGGARPIPSWKSDVFRLSRVLRIDGEYRFYANNKPVSKTDVVDILGNFGINPDNMLLIMHQGMVASFAYVSPQEKLSMLEEAVGLSSYRKNVLEARDRLARLIEEEKTLDKLIDEAKRNLEYWDEEYRRYLEKLKLQKTLEFLKNELLWAQAYKAEKNMENLKSRIEGLALRVKRIEGKVSKLYTSIDYENKKLKEFKESYRESLEKLLSIEEKRITAETSLSLISRLLNLLDGSNFDARILETLNSEADRFSQDLPALRENVSSAKYRLEELENNLDESYSRILQFSVERALAEDQLNRMLLELRELEGKLTEAESEFKEALAEASKSGGKVKTDRNPQDIQSEIRVVEAKIETIGDIPEDTRQMYEQQLNTLKSLEEKTEKICENRKAAEESLRNRMILWRRKIQELLEEVNRSYLTILSALGAIGYVKLTNPDNIDAAGLELFIGFRGMEPTPLNPYTQSGGERSIAVATFLLALQKYIKSPFRAVDEFEVHMDIRNRETFLLKLVEVLKETKDAQYLIITPNQIPIVSEDIHVIVVQNLQGSSEVVEVAEA
ncbi:AAA family ATPase [Candidatus Bathyarchaeota archaeon]|nr:AAA family ATPase [Candidatus Bathyarchaeota archaeon]MBS7617334.1 AAA family ATPase [Candidatus Bathyarchaeota archaeon]